MTSTGETRISATAGIACIGGHTLFEVNFDTNRKPVCHFLSVNNTRNTCTVTKLYAVLFIFFVFNREPLIHSFLVMSMNITINTGLEKTSFFFKTKFFMVCTKICHKVITKKFTRNISYMITLSPATS